MGCSDSKVIETSETRNGAPEKKSQKKSSPTQAKDGVTVKEFFDAALELPPVHGEPYSQPQLPNHYVQQNVAFDNDNVEAAIWDTKIKKQLKKTKESTKKTKGDSEFEIAWHYRKSPNRKYIEFEDALTINIEFDQMGKKKHVVVMGGLYLGSSAANGDNVFDKIDVDSTHSLVILGNLFDTLSTDPFHQAPSDITQIESILAQSEPVLATIRGLAEHMNVYYMRGSFDLDITRVAIERLLGDKVTCVQQTRLILALKVGNETYRLQLTPGQQWDFLFHSSLPDNQLLVGKPIGHYLARASAANPMFSTSALMKPITSEVPTELSKDFLHQISKRPLQDKITGKMLMCAFGLSKPEDLIEIKCLVDEGKYISVQSLLEYPYIKYLLAQHGEEKLMAMFKATVGDYSGVAKSCCEDVIITGLGDQASLSKVPTESGVDIICASTGSCSRRSDKMTMLRVTYPKQGSNGRIEVVDNSPEAGAPLNGEKPKHGDMMTPVNNAKADTLSVESL